MAKDTYAQLAYISVAESAANTLTITGMSVFSNVLSQQGMMIHRVNYTFPKSTWALLAATNDELNFGVCGDDQIDTITLGDARVYDGHSITRQDAGTAANSRDYHSPITVDLSSLPGGGMLVPADRLFGYAQGANLSGAMSVTIRVFFTLLDMGAADYLELAQALRVLR